MQEDSEGDCCPARCFGGGGGCDNIVESKSPCYRRNPNALAAAPPILQHQQQNCDSTNITHSNEQLMDGDTVPVCTVMFVQTCFETQDKPWEMTLSSN